MGNSRLQVVFIEYLGNRLNGSIAVWRVDTSLQSLPLRIFSDFLVHPKGRHGLPQNDPFFREFRVYVRYGISREPFKRWHRGLAGRLPNSFHTLLNFLRFF